MALTTSDGTKLGQKLVEDVNANVEIPAREAAKLSPEAAILFNAAIIAKPLSTPEVCGIHVKNTEYRYRWVNRDGQGGRVYVERRSQGFLNATLDDVEILSADAETKDGEIRSGDLILMKIRADLYDAAIKLNMLKARHRARKAVADDVAASLKSFRPFVPTDADALVNDSISSGRVEEARQLVEELRAKTKGASKE